MKVSELIEQLESYGDFDIETIVRLEVMDEEIGRASCRERVLLLV